MQKEVLYKGLKLDRRIKDYTVALEFLSGDNPNVIHALKHLGRENDIVVGLLDTSDESHNRLIDGIRKLIQDEVDIMNKQLDSL